MAHLLQAEHLARMKRLPSLDELSRGKRKKPRLGSPDDFVRALLGRYRGGKVIEGKANGHG